MKAGARAPGRSLIWLQGAVAGGVVAVVPGAALLIAVLLCPAIAACFVDTARGRPVARTMLLCGSAATFGPLRALWEGGMTTEAALDILGDVGRPLVAWLACAAGWLLFETVHVAARLALEGSSRRRAEHLRTEASELAEEWTLSKPADNPG